MRRSLFVPALVLALAAGCNPAEPGPAGPEGPEGPAGPTGPAGPAGPEGIAGQNIYEAYGTGQVVVTSQTTQYVTLPGLSLTVNVPEAARVRVDTNGAIQCTAVGNAYSVVDIALFVDGATPGQGGIRRVVAANTAAVAQMIANYSFGRTFTLNAGSHTFEVRTVAVDPGSAATNVSGTAPQIQGVLTVTVLRQ